MDSISNCLQQLAVPADVAFNIIAKLRIRRVASNHMRTFYCLRSIFALLLIQISSPH